MSQSVETLVQRLLAPLDEDQQRLVDTVGDAFFLNNQNWPVYLYVESIFSQHNLDTRSVLASFPVAGSPVAYSFFSCLPHFAALQDASTLDMTLLGLNHYRGGFQAQAEALVRDGLRLLELFVDRRRAFVTPATEVKYLEISSDDVLENLRSVKHDLPAFRVIKSITDSEPPFRLVSGGGKGSDEQWIWTIRGQLSDFAGVGLNFEEYLRRMLLKIHRPTVDRQHRVVPSPLSLTASLGYLDTAWRVMDSSHDHLISSSSPEKIASLAFDAGNRDEYLERMSSLGDTLKHLRVPTGGKQKGGHPVERLRIYLKAKLPAESHDIIDTAFDTLADVVTVRNGGTHSEAEPKLVAAYRSLGLTFPITDYPEAWNLIRASVVVAVDAVRNALLGFADTEPV